MKKVLLIVAALGITGCASHAGPFVTGISSDGKGNIIVEKCMVRLDRMINTVENSNCTNSTIFLNK